MTTHSSVLAWRIPGMGEPGGLPSMGSHKVRQDWSDLAAVAAAKALPKLIFERIVSSWLKKKKKALVQIPKNIIGTDSNVKSMWSLVNKTYFKFIGLINMNMSLELSTLNSVQLLSCSVLSYTLRPHGLQYARPPCPSATHGVYSNSCPLSQWCHHWVSSSHQVAKVLEFQLQHQSFHWIPRTDFL